MELASTELVSVFEDTNSLRNDWKGHDSVAISNEQAEERERRLVPLLDRVRRATPTLWAHWELVRVRRMTRKAGRWSCTVDRLRGANPTFKWAAVETDNFMDEERLYLLDLKVGSPRELVPLLRLGEGSIAYFYDRRDKRGLRWLSQHSAFDNERFEDVPETVAWLDEVEELGGSEAEGG